MMIHASRLPTVSMMTNVQCDLIDDAERVLLSPLRVYLKFY